MKFQIEHFSGQAGREKVLFSETTEEDKFINAAQALENIGPMGMKIDSPRPTFAFGSASDDPGDSWTAIAVCQQEGFE